MNKLLVEQIWHDQGFWSNDGLDRLFREITYRLPNCTALVDNHEEGQRERSLTFAELDACVGCVAEQLAGMALPDKSFVAIRMDNRLEAIIALLACWRAGHGFVYIPCDWNSIETALAFKDHDISALLFYDHDKSRGLTEAYKLAEHIETIRQIACFGEAGDGVTSLGSVTALKTSDNLRYKSAHTTGKTLAQLGWAVGEHGWSPFWRYHNHLRAQGLTVIKAIGLKQGARIMTLMHPLGASGLLGATMPWLLTAGTLRLAYDTSTAALKRGAQVSDFIIAPEALFRKEDIETERFLVKSNRFNGQEARRNKDLEPLSASIKNEKALALTDSPAPIILGRVITPIGAHSPLKKEPHHRVIDFHLANQYVLFPVVQTNDTSSTPLGLKHISTTEAHQGLLALQSRTVDSPVPGIALFATGAAVPRIYPPDEEASNEPDTASVKGIPLGFQLNFIRDKNNVMARCLPVFDQVLNGGQVIALKALDACLLGHPGFVEAGFFIDDQSGRLGLGLVPVAALSPVIEQSNCEALLRTTELVFSKQPCLIFVTDRLPRHRDGSIDRHALCQMAKHHMPEKVASIAV